VSDDLKQGISNLIKHSQGTMPVGLLVAHKSEAEEALPSSPRSVEAKS
jgi:hypothetical protein